MLFIFSRVFASRRSHSQLSKQTVALGIAIHRNRRESRVFLSYGTILVTRSGQFVVRFPLQFHSHGYTLERRESDEFL